MASRKRQLLRITVFTTFLYIGLSYLVSNPKFYEKSRVAFRKAYLTEEDKVNYAENLNMADDSRIEGEGTDGSDLETVINNDLNNAEEGSLVKTEDDIGVKEPAGVNIASANGTDLKEEAGGTPEGADGSDLSRGHGGDLEKALAVILELANLGRAQRGFEPVIRKSLKQLQTVPPLEPGPSYQREINGKLQPTIIPPPAWVKYSGTWNGFPLPIITCFALGRLGNVMGEYATLFALHRFYNVTVLVAPKMKKRLRLLFHNLSLPHLPDNADTSHWRSLTNTNGLYNYSPVELAAAGLLGPKCFMMKEYAFEIQLFHPFREEITKEFTFHPALKKQVQATLKNFANEAKRKGMTNPVLIGIHVRRTDYVQHAKKGFGAELPDEPYFKRAFDYYRKKFPGQTLFVAASDDYNFVRSRFSKYEDVMISPGYSPEFDMAILASCNHSIMTMGSFGFWSSYLTGGEIVYPNVLLKKEYRFSQKMFNQVRIPNMTPLPVN